MTATVVADTPTVALRSSAPEHVRIRHRPRFLSDNGPSYLSAELSSWLAEHSMTHTRDKPYGPATAYAVYSPSFIVITIASARFQIDSHPQPHDSTVGLLRRVTAGIRSFAFKPILLLTIPLDLLAVLRAMATRCCRFIR
jgi:hypothetical protein